MIVKGRGNEVDTDGPAIIADFPIFLFAKGVKLQKQLILGLGGFLRSIPISRGLLGNDGIRLVGLELDGVNLAFLGALGIILRFLQRRMAMLLGGLLGGILLTGADILARSAAASELPVSIFTSLLGAPFLIFLIIKERQKV